MLIPTSALKFQDSIQPADALLTWAKSDWYIQVGFLYKEYILTPEAYSEVTAAMTMIDNLVAITGKIDLARY